MVRLTHATLTEDEGVLVEALSPGAGDLVLCVHARGNGDAALALLAADASERAREDAGHPGPLQATARQIEDSCRVVVCDLFDQEGLDCQLALKLAMLRTWDPATIRRFLALDSGLDRHSRAPLLSTLMAALPPPARAFWHARSSVLLEGMTRADETAQFAHLLSVAAPALEWLARWPRALQLVLRAGLLGAPLFFPPEERAHSLGFQQLRADPVPAVNRLLTLLRGAKGADLVGAASMTYLSIAGLTRLAQRLDRIQVVSAPDAIEGVNAIYLSNVVDYLPATEVARLFERALARARRPCRILLNSTWSGDLLHPALEPLAARGLVTCDADLTRSLRTRDRQKIYPGLARLTAQATGGLASWQACPQEPR